MKYIKPGFDFILTIIFWAYFTLGYIIFFAPRHIWAFLFSKDKETEFQRLNHKFYKIFFKIVENLTPGLKIEISPDVLSIRSSIIVSNHISYLDPILLISLYEKQKTIVKSIFFKIPVFGHVLKASGYLPARGSGKSYNLFLKRIESMNDYLKSGGNLFIFPEGTRSKQGALGKFDKGAFMLARRFNVPIQVIVIKNTNILFTPGKFFFNTCVPNTIKIEKAGVLHPDYKADNFSISGFIKEARNLIFNLNRQSQEKIRE